MERKIKKFTIILLLVSINCLTVRDKDYKKEKLSTLSDGAKMDIVIVPTRIIVKGFSDEAINLPAQELDGFYNAVESQFISCECFREVSVVKPEKVNMENNLQKHKIEINLQIVTLSKAAIAGRSFLTGFTLWLIPSWYPYEITLKATVLNGKSELKKYTYSNSLTLYMHLFLFPFFYTFDWTDPLPMISDLVKQLIFDIKNDRVIPDYK